MPIREWSEDDRPREKLLKHGEQITIEEGNVEIQRRQQRHLLLAFLADVIPL
jgi:DNA repair protein RadC